MHKKAITLTLLAASVAAVATTLPPVKVTRLDPAAVTTAAIAPAVAPEQSRLPAARNDYAQASSIDQAVSTWHSLRQTDRLPFTSYASFLMRYRGWPGETAMRRTAEQAIDNASSPREVAAYFERMPPLTTAGHARHAFALQALGQTEQAREAARKAWHGGVMPRDVEDRLLAMFGSIFGQEDHDKRLATLLDNGDVVSAQRTLAFASGPMRPFHEARIALQTMAPDAMSRVNALGAAANGHAGLLMDRSNWLRDTSQSLAARALLAQPRTLATRPADVEKYYETLLTMAKAAANDRQWTTAYQIASQIDDAYPAGTDVSVQEYGERDDYTSLAWLAGTTAFYELNRPADAMGMFERYARAARSPQTRTKGFYWAGRAAVQAQQNDRANAFFETAAEFPDQYYGQLALERLGRSIQPPAASAATPTAEGRLAFAQRDLVEAIKYLGRTGRHEDQSMFIRSLSEQLHSMEERELASELSREIGRPDLGVWVARNARDDGVSFYTRANFPLVRIPAAYQHQSVLDHAIMRQESSFDRMAESPVGARGMMQLMPATARETAGKLGLSYDRSRLTSDPQYNIMLGSKYFSDMMDNYGGYAPLAIAAYNAGPGNVRRWLRENGDPRTPQVDVVRWIEEIPFFETKNYVQRVLENAVVYDAMAGTPTQNRLSWYLGKRQPG